MTYKHKHLLLIIFSGVLATALPFFINIGIEAPLIIFALYFLTKGLGSEIGAHRLWSHRSFTVNKFWQRLLIVLDTLSGEGSIIAFAGIHRAHHSHSDTERDPHNPKSNLWGTIFYQHNTESFRPSSIKDLFADTWLIAQHRHYFKIQVLVFVLLSLLSTVALWYYAVNVLVTLYINFLVDVACHKWGSNDNQLNNNSKNNRWADLFLLGVGLHNNHHADPSNFRNNWGAYRFDIWGDIINLIRIKNG